MTNKLRYFIANWKMYGDLPSLKVLKDINFFLSKNKQIGKNKVIACVPNILIKSFSSQINKKFI